MVAIVDLLLVLSGAALALPCLVLAAECLAGRRPHRRRTDATPPSFRLLVMVPAHDEAGLIGPTITHLRDHLRNEDRIVVVADNCTDDTAAQASHAGAEVLVRTDPERRGKGWALEFGLEQMALDPPDAVVFFDADCRVARGSIAQLAAASLSKNCPLQADYLIQAPAEGGSLATVSALALLLINRIRPLGLRRMGFPCQLTGTGMAMPWALAASLRPTGSNLVEDLAMGIDLALQGHPPRYCPDVEVTSTLPRETAAAIGQRRRWEHGRLASMGTVIGPLVVAGLRQRRADLLVLALDLLIPPLALLALIEVTAFAVLLFAAVAGGPWFPVVLLVGSGLAATVAVGAALRAHAEDFSLLQLLVAVPRYVAKKFMIYATFPFRRQASWDRTQRDSPENEHD